MKQSKKKSLWRHFNASGLQLSVPPTLDWIWHKYCMIFNKKYDFCKLRGEQKATSAECEELNNSSEDTDKPDKL